MFLGAIAKGISGFFEKDQNIEKITALERLLEEDFFIDFTNEERENAFIKIKQVALEKAILEKASFADQIQIEKEIVNLMEHKLKSQQQELSSKHATQLDIAHTLLSMQKANTEIKNYITVKDRFNDKFIKETSIEVTSQIKRLDKLVEELNASCQLLIEESEEKVDQSIRRLEKQVVTDTESYLKCESERLSNEIDIHAKQLNVIEDRFNNSLKETIKNELKAGWEKTFVSHEELTRSIKAVVENSDAIKVSLMELVQSNDLSIKQVDQKTDQLEMQFHLLKKAMATLNINIGTERSRVDESMKDIGVIKNRISKLEDNLLSYNSKVEKLCRTLEEEQKNLAITQNKMDNKIDRLQNNNLKEMSEIREQVIVQRNDTISHFAELKKKLLISYSVTIVLIISAFAYIISNF